MMMMVNDASKERETFHWRHRNPVFNHKASQQDMPDVFEEDMSAD